MSTNPPRVGLYGGTFDPIHLGHINLALQIKEEHELDAIWFCPANVSPGRLDHEAALPEHRLKMVELATRDIDGFEVVGIEVERQGPSYTIDTIRQLLATHTFEALYLVMSDEVAATVNTWRDPQELLALALPLIGRRILDFFGAPSCGNPRLDGTLARGYKRTDVFEISATTIRKRLRKGLYCGHLLPAPVLAYINETRLYL